MKVKVYDITKKSHLAWVYYRTGQAPGLPSSQYLNDVIEGARQRELPGWYIGRLQKIPTC